MTIEVQGKGCFSEVKYYYISKETEEDTTKEGLFIMFLDGKYLFFENIKDVKTITVRKF